MQGSPYQEYEKKYTEWLTRLGYAESTIKSYSLRLAYFFNWLATQAIHQLETVQQSDLETFKAHLETRPNQHTQAGLSTSYINSHFASIRLLNQYQQLIGEPPILKGHIKLTKDILSAPNTLTQQQIKQLYAMTDDSPAGYRDRAMLSLYYGCGLRISEGIRVEIKDIYYEKELLYVKAGKSNKSRYIPINTSIQKDLKEYETYARPYFLTEDTTTYLLSQRGKSICPQTINKRLKQLANYCHIDTRIYAHLLRHSIATHLLQAGMELESISQFLGHNSLEATEIYTHVAYEELTKES